jgi:streptogramin lyase
MVTIKNFGAHFENLEFRRYFSFQTFNPPTPSTQITNETIGKDGSLYFVEQDQQQIGRILPNGNVVEYEVPDTFGKIGTLVTAKDGSIWFNTTGADSPLLGHLTTKGRITSVAINDDALTVGAANDGTVWFSSLADGLGRVNTKNKVSYFATDTTNVITKIISGPAGSIYFASVQKSTDPSTTPYLFEVHSAAAAGTQLNDNTLYSGNSTFNFDNGPQLDTAANLTASQGDLWFYDGYNIKSVNPSTGDVNSGPITPINQRYPNLKNLSSLTTGWNGDLWCVDRTIGGQSYDISSSNFIPTFTNGAKPYAIVNAGYNTAWITDASNGQIYKSWQSYAPNSNALSVPVFSGGSPQEPGGVYYYDNVVFENTGLYDTVEIQRASSINGKYSTLERVNISAGDSLNYQDNAVKSGQTFYYRVRSVSTNSILVAPVKVSISVNYYQDTNISFQPFTPPSHSHNIQNETVGPDGSLYFAEVDKRKIGKILSNGSIVEYAIPSSYGTIGTLVTAQDIWFNTTNAASPRLGHLLTNGHVKFVSLSSDATALGAANDGTIWFYTQGYYIGQIGTDGNITFEQSVPYNTATKFISGPNGSVYYSSVAKSNDPSTTPYLFQIHVSSFVNYQWQDRIIYSGNTPFNFDNGPEANIAGNLDMSLGMFLDFYDGYSFRQIDISSGSLLTTNQNSISGLSGITSLIDGPTSSQDYQYFVYGGQIYVGTSFEIANLNVVSLPIAGSAYALANGGSNTIWVTDQSNGVIYKWTPNAGNIDNLTGSVANLGPNGQRDVTLSFDNLGLYDTFQVERADDVQGNYTVVGTVSNGTGPVPTFYDNTVTAGKTYSYQIYSTSTDSIVAGPISVTVY